MYFNEFVNNRRKELGMSIDELVTLSRVPKGTLSKITSGINTNPTLTTVEAICRALKCSLNDAVGMAQNTNISNEEINYIKKYRTLDEYGKKAVDSILDIEYARCTSATREQEEQTKSFITIHRHLNKASAGYGYDLNNRDEWKKIKVVDEPAAQNADFAVEVEGDSMLPDYQDGDLVLVVLDPDVPVGKVGLFQQGGKGYIKERGMDRLISRNPDFPDICGEVRCVGRVIGIATVVN